MIDPTCSFCGKMRREVSKLVAKGEAMICDECVLYCVEVLSRDRTAAASREWLGRLKRRVARAELEPAPPPENLITLEAARAKAKA
jgi:ATP-dependent protease Clp ATPase subunit